MAKLYEFDKELHLIFIDNKQAYDSIDRDKLWKALEVLSIPQKYVSLIRGCNKKLHAEFVSCKKCQKPLR